jgi:hypothetical protein
MSFIKKAFVGITAVAAIAYSLRRWRSSSTDVADQEFATEQQSPAAD